MVFCNTDVVFRDRYLMEFCKEEPSICVAAMVAKRPAVPTPGWKGKPSSQSSCHAPWVNSLSATSGFYDTGRLRALMWAVREVSLHWSGTA